MQGIRLAAVATAALVSHAAQSHERSLEERLIALEKQSWEAWQRMDAVFWQNFLSDDHVEVSAYSGAVGKRAVIDGIARKVCHVNSYKVDRFTFRRFDDSTAMLVYRAEQDTMCGTMTVPSPVWATSLYKRGGRRWVNVLYEHTPLLAPKPKP